MSVNSEKLYSPQAYLELVMNKTFIIASDNDVEFIEKTLEDNDICYWSYPLSEIEHIVENKLNVVLVDCLVYNEKNKTFEHVYRWFEVDGPDDDEEDETEELTNPLDISLNAYPLVTVNIIPWLDVLNFKIKKNKIIDKETSDMYYLNDIKESIEEYVTNKIAEGWDVPSLAVEFFASDVNSFKKDFISSHKRIDRKR